MMVLLFPLLRMAANTPAYDVLPELPPRPNHGLLGFTKCE
jgi:hypothetical protein